VNELDEILSDNGEAVPENLTTEPSQPRDDNGRFSQTAIDAGGENFDPVVNGNAPEDTNHSGGIPAQRLKAEADKRREAEASAEALRREIAELRGMVQANSTPKPQQAPREEPQPATIWDNPEVFLGNQLSPIQAQMQEMRELMWEGQAAQTHGMETLAAAKTAAEALFGTPEGAELHRKLTSGGNPFDQLVKWHKQQQAFAKVGEDPDAWLEAELEKRLSDPAEQAKIIERLRTGAANQSNRSQPLLSLPPSLNRLPSGGNQAADNDMSDGSLFSHATR
jgi:hypothetical protein